MINVKYIKLNESALTPSRGSAQAAAYDLYACLTESTVTIAPHSTKMIGTGIAMAIPDGYFGGIYARSGLASKSGLRPANCVGVVDSDYRGEIIVALHNDSDKEQIINNKDRIAQLIIQPYLQIELCESESLDDTSRGQGGFGSTGR